MHRRVEYLPDGVPLRASVAEVIAAWVLCTARIPPQYAVASAQHEANFAVNERDHETPDEHGNVYVSDGIYQLAQEEAAHVGMPHANLLDLVEASRVFARLQEERLAAIMRAAKITAPTADCFAYCALAHNEGTHAALKSIAAHGLDWAAWVARNPALDAMARYGSDCITGGSHFPRPATV